MAKFEVVSLELNSKIEAERQVMAAQGCGFDERLARYRTQEISARRGLYGPFGEDIDKIMNCPYLAVTWIKRRCFLSSKTTI